MNDDPRKNYCTHAAQFFLAMSAELSSIPGISRAPEEFLWRALAGSVKFILPDNGILFEDTDYKPSMFELQRLPFPLCALEFSADEALYAPETGLHFSGKRIALCFDPHSIAPELQALYFEAAEIQSADELPERCHCIISVYDAPEHGIWSPSMGAVCIDLERDAPVPAGGGFDFKSPGAERASALLRSASNSKPSQHGLPVTYIPFPERARMAGISMQDAIQTVYLDTVDEIRAAWQFMAAANCSNVRETTLRAPAALNAKRAKKGKIPFFDYHILDLDPGTSGARKSHGEPGSHASPRTHLRRGHIRRINPERSVWINATLVNKSLAAGGIADKDYRLHKR